MARTSLPPGYRFHPTDVELVLYYLKRKIMGKPFHVDAITEIELYKFAPWDLPEKSQLGSKDLEWYFLCPQDKKHPNGSRTNRTTEFGYWKASGKDRSVLYNSHIVGMKKTLIFHIGKPPKGDRTDWVMYEYRLQDKEVSDAEFSLDAYSLCKIFQKSGLGPKIGEQYGAPFNEADWEDDTNNVVSLPFLSCSSSKILHDEAISAPVFKQPITSDEVEDPLDPDPSDLDGFFIEDLAELLKSPLEEHAIEKISDVPLLEKNTEVLAIDFETVYNELEEGISTQLVLPEDNNFIDKDQIGCSLDSILSELYSDQYIELNDLSFSGDNDAYMSPMQDCLLGLHSFDQSLCINDLNNNILTSNIDTTFVGDSFSDGVETNLGASSPCLQIGTSDIFVPPSNFP